VLPNRSCGGFAGRPTANSEVISTATQEHCIAVRQPLKKEKKNITTTDRQKVELLYEYYSV